MRAARLAFTTLVAAAAVAGCGRALAPAPAPKAMRPMAALTSLKKEPTHLPIGAKVPAMPITALDGSADALEKHLGKPLLLVFWATWCPTCTNELPHLEAIWQDFGPRGLDMVLVNASNEKLTKIQNLWTWQNYTMPVFGQYTGAAARDFLINNIPTLYWVGKDGLIQDVHVGEEDPATLRARTARLLEAR